MVEFRSRHEMYEIVMDYHVVLETKEAMSGYWSYVQARVLTLWLPLAQEGQLEHQ